MSDRPHLPFVRPALVFAAGIIIGSLAPSKFWLSTFVGLFIILWKLHRLRTSHHAIRSTRNLLLWLTLLCAGAANYFLSVPKHATFPEGKIYGELVTLERSKCTETYSNAWALTRLNGSFHKVSLFFRRDSLDGCLEVDKRYRFGGRIQAFGEAKNPADFDMKGYAFSQGLEAQIYLDSIQVVGSASAGSARLRGRSWLLKQLKAIPTPEVRHLLYALLSGDKTLLAPETRTHFSRAGIMHLLAVSGLHVGLIAWLPLMLLRKQSRRSYRIFTAAFVILLVWSFAWFTGLSASVMRAAAMISLLALGAAFFKRVSTINTLAGVGFIMLIGDPLLLFHPGFQLSFAAVAAIVLWAPRIQSKWPQNNRWQRWLAQSSSVALAAQMGTSPFAVYHFGQFPLLFLPANLIAVPLATGLLYTLLLCLLLASTGLPTSYLLTLLDSGGRLLLKSARMFGAPDYAAVDKLELSLSEAALWLLLACLLMLPNGFHINRLIGKMSILTACLIGVFFLLRVLVPPQLIFFTSNRPFVFGLTGRMQSAAICEDAASMPAPLRRWAEKKDAKIIELNKDTCISHEGIELCRRGDAALVGEAMIIYNHKPTSKIDGYKSMKLSYRDSRTNLLCKGAKLPAEWSLEDSALIVEFSSNGTIGGWYARHRPPIPGIP